MQQLVVEVTAGGNVTTNYFKQHFVNDSWL